MQIDTPTVTLIAAALAALVAIMNTFLTASRQTRLEREKWQRTRDDEMRKWELLRQDEAAKSVRLAVAEVARLLASAAQAVSWLTWNGTHAPDLVTESDFDTYNKAMKTLFPQIVGAHLLLVALDKRTDETINPLVQQLYLLDEEVAKASVLFAKSPTASTAALAACYSACNDYFGSLHERFKNLLSENRSLA
jgi:cell division protein FtsL